MMSYADFVRLDANSGSTLDVNLQYDNREMKRGKLAKHDLGWNIRANEPGKPVQYGILHLHWAPKTGSSTHNLNISAHFKEVHGSQFNSGKGNQREIPRPQDNVLYNRLVVLNPLWTAHKSAERSRPPNAKTGWTSLKSARITKEMVDAFRQTNDQAALSDLGRNGLYDMSKWDHAGWNSYMYWMAGATE